MKKNDLTTVKITDVTGLGYGVSHADGMTVFVDGGVTGDVMKVKIIKTAKDYLVGRTEEIINPSRYRQKDLCPVHRCGGCVLGHLKREYELELKRGFVVSAFRKHGLTPLILPVATDGRREGYRNKAQIPVSGSDYGFYARHSHEIVPFDRCLLSPPVFSEIAAFVCGLDLPGLRHIFIRGGETVMLCLVSSLESFPDEKEAAEKTVARFPQISSVLLNFNPDDTNVILGEKTRVIYGRDLIFDTLLGCRFGISLKSFYQVNRPVAEMMYEEVISRVPDGAVNIADLYCGIGSIGICLASARKNISLTGIEIVPEAVENARLNAETNGVTNASFVCSDALDCELDGFDCVIVDPPRKGLASPLAEKLARSAVKHIVYVSCNPETLARDTKMLTGEGFAMSSVRPFDMFPRTGSVESVTDFYR